MKVKNRMRYTRKQGSTTSPNTGSPSKAVSSSWRLYQDCGRLDLERFLDVLYDKEFDRLIIEGSPPEQAIKDAWNKIYLQYSEMAGDGSYNEALDKTTKVNLLNGKIFLINGIVQHLKMGFDPELVKMLNFMGYPCDLKLGDDPEPKLKQVIARAKRLVIEMETAQRDLEKLQAIATTGTGRDYYDDWLDALSRHRAYTVKAKDITVTQFFKAIKRVNEESLKQQHAR
jgi:hypothetical protein